MKKVAALCCTYNRVSCLRRSLRCFLDQDYEGEAILIIYNNSPVPLFLGEMDLPNNREIRLVNNHIDRYTRCPYNDLGAIHRDALHSSPPVDLVVHWDDDDLPLPNHISEGVKGFERGRDLNPEIMAYKPYYSYIKQGAKITKSHNVFEPSVFIDYNYLMEAGYNPANVKHHHAWLLPIQDTGRYYIDPDGPSTWLYLWTSDLPTRHASAFPDNQDNFDTHRREARDFAGGPLTPLESNQKYYNQVYGNTSL